ncbi:hypothetical protein HNP65_001165 [Thermosipho japonicus]|uniref:Lipoprotein n=1 Tax=Thermosipho japonicus TaxID=90323 RepID=A0A841GS00_9BACT|nr:hypothetical protein [Thermosipho japonicus]MBB6062713.1 hypothetical protein [Thermosipho japonicus]
MKKYLLFTSIFVLFFIFFGCMTLFNLSLDSGMYVAGDWNNWMPTEKDKMQLNNGFYMFELPVSSITFTEGSSGHIGWYKVIYVGTGESKIQSSVPVWQENLGDATSITIYASPNLMHDGYAVGAGDSEKEMGDWYCAGEFNSWTLSKMSKVDDKYVYEIEREVSKGEGFYFKIARNSDWKPWEEQFDGKNYNAGMGQDGYFVADKDGSSIVVEYYPQLSILKAFVK